MELDSIIEQLQYNGTLSSKGMSEDELESIQKDYNIIFPAEIHKFFLHGIPVIKGFWNYRDTSVDQIKRFNHYQKEIDNRFVDNIKHNHLCQKLGGVFTDINQAEAEKKILEWLHKSPKIAPLFGTRCFFSGLNGFPILSFIQPVDTIIYGINFESWLQIEFLNMPYRIPRIKESYKAAGIWYEILCINYQ